MKNLEEIVHQIQSYISKVEEIVFNVNSENTHIQYLKFKGKYDYSECSRELEKTINTLTSKHIIRDKDLNNIILKYAKVKIVKKGAPLEGEIASCDINNIETSLWEGRISCVKEILELNKEDLAEINNLLKGGAISKEFNQIHLSLFFKDHNSRWVLVIEEENEIDIMNEILEQTRIDQCIVCKQKIDLSHFKKDGSKLLSIHHSVNETDLKYPAHDKCKNESYIPAKKAKDHEKLLNEGGEISSNLIKFLEHEFGMTKYEEYKKEISLTIDAWKTFMTSIKKAKSDKGMHSAVSKLNKAWYEEIGVRSFDTVVREHCYIAKEAIVKLYQFEEEDDD